MDVWDGTKRLLGQGPKTAASEAASDLKTGSGSDKGGAEESPDVDRSSNDMSGKKSWGGASPEFTSNQ